MIDPITFFPLAFILHISKIRSKMLFFRISSSTRLQLQNATRRQLLMLTLLAISQTPVTWTLPKGILNLSNSSMLNPGLGGKMWLSKFSSKSSNCMVHRQRTSCTPGKCLQRGKKRCGDAWEVWLEIFSAFVSLA